ncbi:hypothetical protein BH18VER1_BH18VER1_19080 [soil metagenome]
MKLTLFVAAAVGFTLAPLAATATASQARNSRITITAQNPGAKPFISKLNLSISNLKVLTRIQFTIRPKPGSVTRPLSATYSKEHLRGRGFVSAATGQVTFPVYGLYDNYNNTVTLKYTFADGSWKKAVTTIPTALFDDACDLNTPHVRKARSATTELSYDYMLIASSCSGNAPTIIDTDGAVRWVGTAGIKQHYTTFFRNGIYTAHGSSLLRMELDGEVSVVADYASEGVIGFHHNIDRGRSGMIIDVHTSSYIATVHLEVDRYGKILKRWNLADIIRQAMIEGGDDPASFVREANGNYTFQAYEDWTHNNATTYRKSDNSLIISSRENFVICLDYDTSAIKWILGDTAKEWYQYPSLRKYALAMAPGSIAPVGQHTVSITKDDNLLLFDNGQRSVHHVPTGPNRSYSAPRKYSIDVEGMIATELWNFPNEQSIRSAFRSSVYEDAPNNYLIDYAIARNPDGSERAQLVGLAASGEKVFDYSYPTTACCHEAYRAIPLHWERLMFVTPIKTE